MFLILLNNLFEKLCRFIIMTILFQEKQANKEKKIATQICTHTHVCSQDIIIIINDKNSPLSLS